MTPTDTPIKNALSHRTIREFTDQPVPKEDLSQIFEVARRTATSNGLQQWSVIHVTEPLLKKELSQVANQEYVARIPELFIFIADQFRNSRIVLEKTGEIYNASDADRFFQAFTDAALAAQNTVNAAEQMGYGTLYLGSILNDPVTTCRLLDLPRLTFPVVGLGIGTPAQAPQLKPRFENRFRYFENRYRTDEPYVEKFAAYDEEMQTYYDLRDANHRVDSFTDQVVAKMKINMEKRNEILSAAKMQGFNL